MLLWFGFVKSQRRLPPSRVFFKASKGKQKYARFFSRDTGEGKRHR